MHQTPIAPRLVRINSTWLILISRRNALFRGEFMPSLYLKQLYSITVNLKQLYSIAVNLLTLFFKGLQRITWFHYVITDKRKGKNSTSNKVITLLDETRLDETGVDEMSIRRNRIRRTGPNSLGRWWGLYGDLTDCLKDESPVISLLLWRNLIAGSALYRGNSLGARPSWGSGSETIWAIDILISQVPTLPHYGLVGGGGA